MRSCTAGRPGLERDVLAAWVGAWWGLSLAWSGVSESWHPQAARSVATRLLD